MPRTIVVLGPQRPDPNIRAALDAVQVEGRVALVTAGWRHEEHEIGPLRRALGRPAAHLPLYAWFEELGREHPHLQKAYSQRQERVRAVKNGYRIRLHAALNAVAELLPLAAEQPEVFEPDLQATIGEVQRIDGEILDRVASIRAAFPEVARPWEDTRVRAYHDKIVETLADSAALLIAGGQVAVLKNRMAFFGVSELLPAFADSGRPVVAWSAGAMALTDHIVLFYDDPPEGAGHPEVHDAGFGLVKDVVFFPHARLRLRLGDRVRTGILTKRFAPACCVALETGAWQVYRDGVVTDRSAPGATFDLAGTL